MTNLFHLLSTIILSHKKSTLQKNDLSTILQTLFPSIFEAH